MDIYTINLGSTLRKAAHKYPNRLALVSPEGERLTYQELNLLSNRFANALLKLGIKKGEHIATLFLNCNEQLIAFFGILKIGGIVLPLNARLAAPEMHWILGHSDSTAVIFSKDFQDRVEGLRPELRGLRHYVMVGEEPPADTLRFGKLLEQSSDEDPQAEVFGDDEAFLLYTAGTTGRPKGVLITHNGLIWNCVSWVHAGVYREDDLSLHVFPLYHIAALGSVLTYIYLGGTIYLKKAFDPKDCMETIQKEKITRWAAAPTVFNMLLQLQEIESYDTDSLTLLGSGSAIMPSETQRKLREVFPNAQIFDTYGMTEASGGITTLSPQDSNRKSACVGKPVIGVEMRVVDGKDRDVAPGEVGEVVFRGNNMMKGYYKDYEATDEAMRGGWFHTGDLGRLDEEGYLYIVDRKKDMIVTGGENVYPREVEEVLYAHPKIAEAAVIGVADPKWVEAIKAVVTLKPGETTSGEEIIDFCRERIAGFKCPKSVDLVQTLPKNAAGKILKRELRERYGASVTYE